MKKIRMIYVLVSCLANQVFAQEAPTFLVQNLVNKKIASTVEITSDTRSTIIGLNNKNIQTIPTGRQQTTKRTIEFKKEATGFQGTFTIQHIKATIYGGSEESTYDSDNTFERSGNAAMFAVRTDPWVGKKMKSLYKEGIATESMDEKALPTWLASSPFLSINPELSGLIQTSRPKIDWRIGLTWTDTIQGLSATYINFYKISGISDQIISLTINGKSIPSLNSLSTTSESKGSIYDGTIEFMKNTGIIQKMEFKRESEVIDSFDGNKMSSITTTKTVIINKVL